MIEKFQQKYKKNAKKYEKHQKRMKNGAPIQRSRMCLNACCTTCCVSSMMPTMYGNVFSFHDTLLLWDQILSSNCNVMFKSIVQVMVQSILYHKNEHFYIKQQTKRYLINLHFLLNLQICQQMCHRLHFYFYLKKALDH